MARTHSALPVATMPDVRTAWPTSCAPKDSNLPRTIQVHKAPTWTARGMPSSVHMDQGSLDGLDGLDAADVVTSVVTASDHIGGMMTTCARLVCEV